MLIEIIFNSILFGFRNYPASSHSQANKWKFISKEEPLEKLKRFLET